MGEVHEHEGGVADKGDASGARKPVLHYAHFRAIVTDRQF
jgi:hypothetical protein